MDFPDWKCSQSEIADCKRIAETLELIEQRCAMPPVGPVI